MDVVEIGQAASACLPPTPEIQLRRMARLAGGERDLALGPTDASSQKDAVATAAPVSIRRAFPSSGWIHSPVVVPSFALTSSDWLSGIQIARCTLRSSVRVTLADSPPVAGPT